MSQPLIMTSTDVNKKNYKPPAPAIKERYYSQHRGSAAGPSDDEE